MSRDEVVALEVALALSGNDCSTPEGRAAAAEQMVGFLREHQPREAEPGYLDRAALELGMDTDTLRRVITSDSHDPRIDRMSEEEKRLLIEQDTLPNWWHE